LDRRRQRKITKWDKHHKDYITTFNAEVKEATDRKVYMRDRPKYRQEAFDTYLGWYLARTRVRICPPAYEELLEDMDDDAIVELRYNKAVREGNRTDFAPVMNFMVIFAQFISSHHN
jgi:hypothetical protein